MRLAQREPRDAVQGDKETEKSAEFRVLLPERKELVSKFLDGVVQSVDRDDFPGRHSQPPAHRGPWYAAIERDLDVAGR